LLVPKLDVRISTIIERLWLSQASGLLSPKGPFVIEPVRDTQVRRARQIEVSSTPFTVVTTGSALKQALGAISRHQVIGVDTETTSLDPFRGRVRLLQLATAEQNFVIDLFALQALEHQGLRELLSSTEPSRPFTMPSST